MKKRISKELKEWIVLIFIAGIIYLGGWHTQVIGKVQQLVLATGVIQPGVLEEEKIASYDFWLEDLEGNRTSFKDFEGKVVFVNFWATWCPPCIAEMPDIHKLYKAQSEHINFVMVSLDKEEQKARDFVTNKEFTFPIYFLRSRLPEPYDIHSIPTTYLIDKKGYIKIENHGMAKYNTEKFNLLLDELLEAQ